MSRRSLGGEQRPGRAGRERDLCRHVLAPLPLDHELVDVLDPALAHDLLEDREAEDDAGLLLDDPSPPPRPLRHRHLRGDVARADVLGQRAGDEIGQGGESRHGHLYTPNTRLFLTHWDRAAFNP